VIARLIWTATVAAALTFATPVDAEAPHVVTGPADVRGGSAVTGTGTINDGGIAGTWHFEYSYSSGGMDFPMTTPLQHIAASPDDQAVNTDLPNIASGQTYLYRLVLDLSSGPVAGDWVQFTTPVVLKGPPPIPRALISSRRLHLARDHRIPIRIGCRPSPLARGRCIGSVQLFTDETPAAPALTVRHRVTIPLGGYVTARLRLATRGRRLIGRGGLTAYVVVLGFEGPNSADGAFRPLSLR
jgi:hypothetical protein